VIHQNFQGRIYYKSCTAALLRCGHAADTRAVAWHATVGAAPGLSRGVANLFIPMGNLMNTGSTHIVHSHRINPHFPSSSACAFFLFFFRLFDTRLDHKNDKCLKHSNYNHKHRTNPFNIAGSAQPRFINAFRISKTNILLMRRRQPIKVAKPSLFFLTS